MRGAENTPADATPADAHLDGGDDVEQRAAPSVGMGEPATEATEATAAAGEARVPDELGAPDVGSPAPRDASDAAAADAPAERFSAGAASYRSPPAVADNSGATAAAEDVVAGTGEASRTPPADHALAVTPIDGDLSPPPVSTGYSSVEQAISAPGSTAHAPVPAPPSPAAEAEGDGSRVAAVYLGCVDVSEADVEELRAEHGDGDTSLTATVRYMFVEVCRRYYVWFFM